MKIVEKEIPFIQNQSFLLILSLILTMGSLLLMVYHGFNLGIDFKGGIKLQYKLSQSIESGKIQEALTKGTGEKILVQQVGQPSENLYAFELQTPKENIDTFSTKVTEVLKKEFQLETVTLIKEEAVGAKAGSEIFKKGQVSVIVAWILILIYIGFRFDFYFSPGAIVALLHDLLIVLGGFAITGREINLTVLAAFLTILGYSVNDTIIVYDRVRENAKKFKSLPIEDLVNQSINETLSRTIVTSLTMFFVVLVLFIMGSGDIKDFAFAMIIGVVTGTYSSIFIASPIYIFLKKHGHRFGMSA
ncbi:MAG: protein translocase subunit SecF [Deltaproteobacteria bacterium]|nr:protein translocase subunit SecF [Deltaproteobacteria bacterium]